MPPGRCRCPLRALRPRRLGLAPATTERLSRPAIHKALRKREGTEVRQPSVGKRPGANRDEYPGVSTHTTRNSLLSKAPKVRIETCRATQATSDPKWRPSYGTAVFTFRLCNERRVI